MTMYSVFSACTSSPVTLLATSEASVHFFIQGDQKVSVHLMITVPKRKNFLNSFNHHDNIVRITDGVSVSLVLMSGDWWGTLNITCN
jgi:hypothetical protein